MAAGLSRKVESVCACNLEITSLLVYTYKPHCKPDLNL